MRFNLTAPERWKGHWNRFWFTEYAPHLIAVFRVFLALVVFYRVSTYFNLEKPLLWEPSSSLKYFADYFYVPYVEWLRPPSYEYFSVLIDLRSLLIATLLIGLFSQTSALLIGLISLYIFLLDETFYFHHLYFLILSCIFCGFMPCGKWLSVDSLIAHWRQRKPPKKVSYWAVRLLQVTVSLMYFFTALSKMNPEWLSGDIMRYCYEAGMIKATGPLALMNQISYTAQAWATVLIEFFLAIGLWLRPTRYWALAIGFSFHLIMDITMPISSYSQQMFVSYILFLKPFEWPRQEQ